METPRPRSAFERCRAIAESDGFEGLIATLLVANAIALALESFLDMGRHDDALFTFFVASQVVFVLEIAVRLLGHGPSFRSFFRDPWNAFDFGVVALSLVPMVGPLSFLARLVRVLRVLRVVSLLARRSRRSPS